MKKLLFVCTQCGNKIEVSVRNEDLAKWKSGKHHVQDCFPYLTPGERELFITGICDDCFKDIFKGSEE